MRRCQSCHINYTGSLKRCPLCGSSLEGNPEGMTFPESELTRSKKHAKRCLIGLTLLSLALVAYVSMQTQASTATFCAASAVVIISYIFIRNVVVHSPGFLRIVERYFLVLIAIALLLLFATGDTRVATFVIPPVTIIALVISSVLVVVFRNSFVQGYAKYLVYDLALGMVPLILLALGLVTQPALSIACAVIAFLLLALMLVLTRKQLVAELQKLFHR